MTIKKIILSALVFTSLGAYAEQMRFGHITEPALTPAVEKRIEGLSREDLKDVHEHYRKLLGKTIQYVRLTTGENVEHPFLTRTLTDRQYIDNIKSMKRKMAQIAPIANKAVARAANKENTIKMMISDISLRDDDDQCTINPIIETMSVGEVHRIDLTCTPDRKHPDETLDTALVLSYSSDYVIRSAAGAIMNVDIFADDARSTHTRLETLDRDIDASVKITIKPI